MRAQYYPGPTCIVRVFARRDAIAIMDCIMDRDTIEEADIAIRRCRMTRKSKWERGVNADFYETRVEWVK